MVEADLHVHTTASDGKLTIREIVEEARKNRLKAVAITDHDTMNSNLEKRCENIGVWTL